LGKLLEYLLNPHYLKNEKIQWSLFFKLLLLFYIISLPVGFIVGLLIKLLNFHDTEFNYNTLTILFAGIILAPIIEEILFRLLLIPKYKNVIIFFCFSICMASMSVIKGSKLYLIIFLIFGVVSFLFLRNKKYLRNAQRFLMNHFYYIFYASCILFGLYHVTNYTPVNYKLLLLMPIIVFPQMVVGAFLGYIRMKFGITYSILFHSITNIFPILVLLFTK
jgi:membrane protease YdiL (CAAX protease family)